MSGRDSTPDRHRLDKWLWCARLFKTRALAAVAVAGGKVYLNGERVKPAHIVRLGDRLQVPVDGMGAEIEILGLPERRSPASEAKAQYAESAASLKQRTDFAEQQRLAGLSRPWPGAKPDKRERLPRFNGRRRKFFDFPPM